MLTLTANIGIGVLRSAMRLVENYSYTEEVMSIDKIASGCVSCSHECGSNSCETCEHKQYKAELKTKRVNEKNKYGERKVLKRNALLLFMYLHFLEVDDKGYGRIDIDEAAEAIGCDIKTVRNNLRFLDKHGYICIGETGMPGYYQFFINGYKMYFKTASEGGRGYTTLSKQFFTKLTALKTINELRLTLRNFLYRVEAGTKSYSNTERTYKEVKREVPAYCTKNTVSNIISGKVFTSIFDVVEKKKTVILDVKEEFVPSMLVRTLKDNCYKNIMAFIHDKNKKLSSKQPTLFRIDYKDMEDLQNIALRYPLSSLLNALEYFYQDYFLNGLKVENIGALIRTIVSGRAKIEACM